MLKELFINVPLIDALEKMSGYAMSMKDIVTKKISLSFEDDHNLQNCSAILQGLLCKIRNILVISLSHVPLGYCIFLRH